MIIKTRNFDESTYQDKDPAPPIVSTDPFHMRNAPCQDTTKGTSQRGRREEESNSIMLLIALIPHRKIEYHARKEAALSDTEEEARG